jgi:23S rRNA (cytosine1962-C5)-methyltransferase
MGSPQTEYRLLDAGNGRKLEQFGSVILDRPCAQAVWRAGLAAGEWARAHASFTREEGNRWDVRRPIPEHWPVVLDGLVFDVQPTDFGHVGVFPEHVRAWRWLAGLRSRLPADRKAFSVLNLFAYSGGATLAAARAGFRVCHLDAARKMVTWARRNAELNGLGAAPIRWIVDDVQKFLTREQRRGVLYDGIILDPPSYGRGTRQELFKIDTHLLELMEQCRRVLSPQAAFVFLTCHTPGYTPLVLEHLLTQGLAGLGGSVEAGEMVLEGEAGVLPVPSGTYAVWSTR